MRRIFIRRQAIKIRKTCKSYAQIQNFLERKYYITISRKTLKRWWKKYQKGWNFRDQSRKPHKLRPLIPKETQERIVSLRKTTGYGSNQLKILLNRKDVTVSQSSIKRIIKKNGLSRGSKVEGMKRTWVRWERKHPNSLWQLDGTQLDDMSWRLPIIDDCSRYLLGVFFYNKMTTTNVIKSLENCIKMHGKPKQILTDNGSEFGGTGEGNNQFDKWCQEKGIHHIRSGVHKPTTVGKTERLHLTMNREMSYCNEDPEHFRFRYNHMRPHMSLNWQTPAEVYFAFHKLF